MSSSAPNSAPSSPVSSPTSFIRRAFSSGSPNSSDQFSSLSSQPSSPTSSVPILDLPPSHHSSGSSHGHPHLQRTRSVDSRRVLKAMESFMY
mmetsp:Transcript_44330/g.73906  ORF Transcript_44330/g.73906 Transcript_44330/m.73906 type:complete len:92 (-) Transcript_44330:414-689(-)